MAPTNKVEVSLVSDEDIPTCFEVISKSFGHDAPLIDNYFPQHDTPSGQEKGSKRLLAWKQSAPDSAFLKAVIQQEGKEQIVGHAIWTLMKEAPPADLAKIENVEEVWPDRDDREFITRLWKDYVVPRTKVINESSGKGVYGQFEQLQGNEHSILIPRYSP